MFDMGFCCYIIELYLCVYGLVLVHDFKYWMSLMFLSSLNFIFCSLNWWFIELFVFTGHMIVHFAITILYIFLQFLGLVYNLDHWFIWSIVALRYCSWSIFILTLFWEFDFMFRGLTFLVPFLVRKTMKAFIFVLFPLFVQITLISDKDGLFLQRSKWGSRIFSTGHPKVSLFEKH